jgi:uncharacterized protein YaaW (UPF0174 family)
MDAKAEKAREYIAECLNNYKSVSGAVLPKVISIDRIFTEPDTLKENVYVLTGYILENKKTNPEDRRLIAAFYDNWKRFKYPTLNQTKRVLSMYDWYNKRKGEKSYQKVEREKLSHIFSDESPSIFSNALRQKEKNPFYKTGYEKAKEKERRKKEALKEKDASYTFAVFNKYSHKERMQKRGMIKEISELLDMNILNKREKFIMERCLENKSLEDIAKKLHVSGTRVGILYQRAVSKINLYRLNIDKPLLERNVEMLGISNRTANILARENITTVKELTEKTKGELCIMKGMGRDSIAEINQTLTDKCLSLKN